VFIWIAQNNVQRQLTIVSLIHPGILSAIFAHVASVNPNDSALEQLYPTVII
jgi:hypothetical protein